MRAYFAQFGNIQHLRLARNRRTGSPKHYAFIQYESSAVADIVQRTMDKYLLFGHILQVRRMAPEQIHESLWKGADKRFKKIPWNKLEAKRHAVPRSREVWERRNDRTEGRREKAKKVCEEYGYEFEVPKVKRVNEVKSKAEREKLATEPEEQMQIEAPVETQIETGTRKTSKRKTALEVEEGVKAVEPIKKRSKRKGRVQA
jgi:nucleolar protein 15